MVLRAWRTVSFGIISAIGGGSEGVLQERERGGERGSGGEVFEAVAVVVVVAARISIACFYFLFLLLFY